MDFSGQRWPDGGLHDQTVCVYFCGKKCGFGEAESIRCHEGCVSGPGQWLSAGVLCAAFDSGGSVAGRVDESAGGYGTELFPGGGERAGGAVFFAGESERCVDFSVCGRSYLSAGGAAVDDACRRGRQGIL